MEVYEILQYIMSYRHNGKIMFRGSTPKPYRTKEGNNIMLPASFYCNMELSSSKDDEEIIEIRAADHGTVLYLWKGPKHPHPWDNYYNLDVEFLNDTSDGCNLDDNEKFFVVDRWVFANDTIQQNDLKMILDAIVSLHGNAFTDPTGKSVKHHMLTPLDKQGKDIPIVYGQVHRNQIDMYLKHLKEKYQHALIEKNMTDVNILKVKIAEIEKIIKDGEENEKKEVLSPSSQISESKQCIRITESDLHKMIKESITRILTESSKKYGPNGYYIEKNGCDYIYNGEKCHSRISVVYKNGKQKYHIDEDDHCYVFYVEMNGKEAHNYENPYIFDELLDAIKMLPQLS